LKTVTAAIIEKDGQVMIARRKIGEKLAGFWEFPGGKVEPGETLQYCLARELKEELGLETEIGAVLAEADYHYGHGSIRLIAMQARVLAGVPTLTVHDRVEWVDPGALGHYELAPADMQIAARLFDT